MSLPPKLSRAFEMKVTVIHGQNKMADRIKNNVGHIRPKLPTRAFFFLMSRLQRKGFSPADAAYWQSKGWTEDKRPW